MTRILSLSLLVPSLALVGCKDVRDNTPGQDGFGPSDDSDVSVLAARLDALEAENRSLQAEVDALEQAMNDVDVFDASDILARLDDVERDVVETAKDAKANANAVASVEGDLADVTQTVATQGQMLTSVKSTATTNASDISSLEDRVDDVEELFEYVTVDANSDEIWFEGANVYIASGSGDQSTINGLGNLILGYGAKATITTSGSHNLVLGMDNAYSGHSSIIAGKQNEVTGDYAAILSGTLNYVSSDYGLIATGYDNEVTASHGAVFTGHTSDASAKYAAVLAGSGNNASYVGSSVVGLNETPSRSYDFEFDVWN